jgi:hypothetical protein
LKERAGLLWVSCLKISDYISKAFQVINVEANLAFFGSGVIRMVGRKVQTFFSHEKLVLKVNVFGQNNLILCITVKLGHPKRNKVGQ